MIEDIYIRSVPLYCERVGTGFFSEPLNLLSNAALFVSVFLIYNLLKRNRVKEITYWFLLVALLFASTGSVLWHSVRTTFAHALDAIPIWIFFLSFLFLLFKNLSGTRFKAVMLTTTFLSLQLAATYLFPEFLNGSVRHVVNGLVFSGILYWVYKKNRNIPLSMSLAFVSYIFAVFFRSIDFAVCPYFFIGTHFFWHILNAVGAYFAVKALVDMKASSRN